MVFFVSESAQFILRKWYYELKPLLNKKKKKKKRKKRAIGKSENG